MEKNIAVNCENAFTKTESHDMKTKEIIPVSSKDSINPPKRKISLMTIEENSYAIQKLIESKIVVREKCTKIISRTTGVQIGKRIKKEYKDGSKSNEATYFR